MAIVGLWLALVVLCSFLKSSASSFGSLCLFRSVTGMPCPTCGSTRAMFAIGRGDIATALALNPLLVLALAVGVVWLAGQALLPGETRAWAAIVRRRHAWLALLAALLLNWIYLFAREMF
jgi:hypothetical protein